jgi:HK97 gp10 family phage protein
MVGTFDYSIAGADELQKVLRAMPDQISEKVQVAALRKGGKIIADQAKQNAPVDEGDLRDAIAVRKTPKKLQSRHGLGLLVVSVKVPPGNHAHLVEFGTGPRRQKNGRFTGQMPAQPFMRPAVDAKSQEAINAIGKELGLQIEKAAEKLAGSFKGSGLAKKRRGGKLRLR